MSGNVVATCIGNKTVFRVIGQLAVPNCNTSPRVYRVLWVFITSDTWAISLTCSDLKIERILIAGYGLGSVYWEEGDQDLIHTENKKKKKKKKKKKNRA
jgi:hypothetical protein